jgi:hypothetical protein
VLQLAALLRRWPATRCNLQRLAALLQQRYYDGQQRAGACWPLQLCCDVQQRWSLLDLAALLRYLAARCTCLAALKLAAPCIVFVFFFFLTQQLEENEWEREKFGHLLSSVPTSFVLALSVVRNAKLPPTTPVATIVTCSLRQQQHEFQKHKKSVAFNMKQQGIEFF